MIPPAIAPARLFDGEDYDRNGKLSLTEVAEAGYTHTREFDIVAVLVSPVLTEDGDVPLPGVGHTAVPATILNVCDENSGDQVVFGVRWQITYPI